MRPFIDSQERFPAKHTDELVFDTKIKLEGKKNPHLSKEITRKEAREEAREGKKRQALLREDHRKGLQTQVSIRKSQVLCKGDNQEESGA